MPTLSPLSKSRLKYKPAIPLLLQKIKELSVSSISNCKSSTSEKGVLEQLFPHTAHHQVIEFKEGKLTAHKQIKVGVVFSGGQSPGGHNVISGLYDALKALNHDSRLYGFCNGPAGIITNQTIEITDKLLVNYRNQGGFNLIGSGRTKIDTIEQFKAVESTIKVLELDGLVVIGGDDSNTNAALLAEYFKGNQISCSVVGVPKTIDGDLKNDYIEISFGFDSASKTYSEIIGNILQDALSARKYYYFIKLMGRSASHITLECALQTHPNMALIGEEVEAEHKTLSGLVSDICDMICDRASIGKDYGAILIPEGIIEFIPEFKQLIKELNMLLAPDKFHLKKIDSFSASKEGIDYIMKFLGTQSVQCFKTLPQEIQLQLMLDRDPHGNVQVSRIETERLFIDLVQKELKYRKLAGKYTGKFSPQPHFCGYEGRSCLPSNFDSQYCYSLGYVAALLVDTKSSGYMSCLRQLSLPVDEWKICGVPLVSMMGMELRHGKEKPVIKKAIVDLKGKAFLVFKENRKSWSIEDDYCCPGPIQFFGSKELTDSSVMTLAYEREEVKNGKSKSN